MAVARRKTGKYVVDWNAVSKGTRLKVHDREWFDENFQMNRDNGGYYRFMCTMQNGSKMEVNFTRQMIEMCGQVVTVSNLINNYITIAESGYFCWYPEMFECVVS